jgi:hypothetical protein
MVIVKRDEERAGLTEIRVYEAIQVYPFRKD